MSDNHDQQQPPAALRAALAALVRVFPVARATVRQRAALRDARVLLERVSTCVFCAGTGAGRRLGTHDFVACAVCERSGVLAVHPDVAGGPLA